MKSKKLNLVRVGGSSSYRAFYCNMCTGYHLSILLKNVVLEMGTFSVKNGFKGLAVAPPGRSLAV